ncbi:hypothetical protein TSMG0124 [Halocynthia phage JM-2012]|uniref:hypothetical protein n=1 Tax=Halocynthia phage JM-2012 TaxID=1173297 RepID=UPI00025C6958|nr:hypothetical protein TSMG0124 [Halocynthia phage JM-2012]AFI55407.1 hypothetical protein TSMG0124 [Halocynthia phage JM-2012]
MSNLSKAQAAITVALGTIVDGELPLEITNDSDEFKKAEESYVKATTFRDGMVGALTTTVANTAKEQFEENEEIEVVSGSMEFGPTTLGATVYRNFKVKGDEGDESIANHVVVTSQDDFTNTVNDALEGIFE